MFRMYDIFELSSITYVRNNHMGRKKEWDVRLTLPLTGETVERMDDALQEGEARVDLIRDAIERELRRRERKS